VYRNNKGVHKLYRVQKWYSGIELPDYYKGTGVIQAYRSSTGLQLLYRAAGKHEYNSSTGVV